MISINVGKVGGYVRITVTEWRPPMRAADRHVIAEVLLEIVAGESQRDELIRALLDLAVALRV